MLGFRGCDNSTETISRQDQKERTKVARSMKTALSRMIRLTILCPMLTCLGVGCSNVAQQSPPKPSILRLIPYRIGEKFGFCDSNKKLVIPAIYDDVQSFSESLAWVEMNGKRGYINQSG